MTEQERRDATIRGKLIAGQLAMAIAGDTIYLPVGTYIISEGEIWQVPNGVNLVGAGKDTVFYPYGSILTTTIRTDRY